MHCTTCRRMNLTDPPWRVTEYAVANHAVGQTPRSPVPAGCAEAAERGQRFGGEQGGGAQAPAFAGRQNETADLRMREHGVEGLRG